MRSIGQENALPRCNGGRARGGNCTLAGETPQEKRGVRGVSTTGSVQQCQREKCFIEREMGEVQPHN